MAYSFAAGTQYLRTTPQTLFTYPFTMNLWFRITSLGTQKNLVMMENSINGERFAFFVSTANNLIFAAVDVNGPIQNSISSVTANTWNMATAVCSSSTSRTIYLNNANATVSTTNRVPTLPTRIMMGAQWNGSVVTPNMLGDIAEVGIWNQALSTQDIASLYRGTKPSYVKPQNLKNYYPLIRDITNHNGTHTVNNNTGSQGTVHYRRYG